MDKRRRTQEEEDMQQIGGEKEMEKMTSKSGFRRKKYNKLNGREKMISIFASHWLGT